MENSVFGLIRSYFWKSSFPRWEATHFFEFDGSGWCGGFCVENVSFQKPGRKNSFGKSAEKLPNDRENGPDFGDFCKSGGRI
jgi:hypothetical protein